VPRKIHAWILLLRNASDQGLVQEVLLIQPRYSTQNALMSSKLHSMRRLLLHQKLWWRGLRLLGSCWRRRLRGSPTAIVALFLLLRWHHLVREGRELIAIDVLAGVNMIILIRVRLLLIVFVPTILILPSLVGVLCLRLTIGAAIAISCLAAALVGGLVVVLASSSLRTTR